MCVCGVGFWVCVCELMFLFFVTLCVHCVLRSIFLLSASKPFWPLHTLQAVSTALELLKSGPAYCDCFTQHTDTKIIHLQIILRLVVSAENHSIVLFVVVVVCFSKNNNNPPMLPPYCAGGVCAP